MAWTPQPWEIWIPCCAMCQSYTASKKMLMCSDKNSFFRLYNFLDRWQWESMANLDVSQSPNTVATACSEPSAMNNMQSKNITEYTVYTIFWRRWSSMKEYARNIWITASLLAVEEKLNNSWYDVERTRSLTQASAQTKQASKWKWWCLSYLKEQNRFVHCSWKQYLIGDILETGAFWSSKGN